MVADQIVVLG